MDADAQAEAVEDGHDREHGAACDLLVAAGGDGLQGQGIEVQARQTDALGGAGGTAGIENGGAVLRPSVVIRQRVGSLFEGAAPENIGVVLRQLGELPRLRQGKAHLHHKTQLVLESGNEQHGVALGAGNGLVDLAIKTVQGQYCLAFGDVQVEADLLRSREGMNHVRYCAQTVQSVEAVQRLGRVGHADGYPVTLADAQGIEGTGGKVNPLQESGVAGFASHEFIGGQVRVGSGGLGHKLVDGQRRIVDGFRHGAVKIEPWSLQSHVIISLFIN